ncbi:AmmeMemoRadiSam system protein B [uncultured Methanobrevibacter sp.]|uniref:AmmeMemoRadiSam system protein B n=1 Tax=uncultured Methanobrevibacter sp. TaxID=253161 RepID=UPI00260FD534
MIREAAVAGAFYESNIKYLRESIEDCFKHKLGPGEVPKLSRINKSENVNAVMVPHAGYVYSGPTAAHAYSKIAQDGFPETFVILCPNHTGFGSEVSVFNEGSWVVPIGVVDVDSELANNIISKSNYASADYQAHIREHSIEVQLPFLKYFSNDFKIVPICMMDQSVEASIDLANSIYEAREELGRNITLIDSTDLSHFKSQEKTIEHDNLVFNEVKSGNTEGLYEVVQKEQITMCGYGPTMVAMEYSKKLSQKNFELLMHSTSGDITLDYASVVGYGSGIWY